MTLLYLFNVCSALSYLQLASIIWIYVPLPWNCTFFQGSKLYPTMLEIEYNLGTLKYVRFQRGSKNSVDIYNKLYHVQEFLEMKAAWSGWMIFGEVFIITPLLDPLTIFLVMILYNHSMLGPPYKWFASIVGICVDPWNCAFFGGPNYPNALHHFKIRVVGEPGNVGLSALSLDAASIWTAPRWEWKQGATAHKHSQLCSVAFGILPAWGFWSLLHPGSSSFI